MNNKELDRTTPLMRQYWDIKSAHPDKIVLYRMGDFYEMFHDDAIVAAPILGIALTSRNKKAADETPMCGVPHHSVAGPINKLLQAGRKVAICDQIEDPKTAKGLVKRAVTRVLSPGMVYDPETLDSHSANYLTSFDEGTVCFLETTTGEFFFYRAGARERLRLFRVLLPSELVLSAANKEKYLTEEPLERRLCLSDHETSLDPGLKVDDYPESALRLLSYAIYMQGPEILSLIKPLEERTLLNHMQLGATVLRHLEVLETYKGDKKGSLFFAINRTKTSSGSRLLKSWLCFPLTDQRKIEERFNRVAPWVTDFAKLKAVRELLSYMGDIERRLGKISAPTCNARDLVALADSLEYGMKLSMLAGGSELNALSAETKLVRTIIAEIRAALIDDPPLSTKQGYFIKQGYNVVLDELISLSSDSQSALRDMELREKELTGIASLKVRYNNIFGYYIEVTNTHKEKVPAERYQRKQTLSQAERFVTPELIDLESKILSAKAKRAELEYELFYELRARVLQTTVAISSLARLWTELDVFTALAWLAIEQKYVRPQFCSNGRLFIEASRHPVVEQESLRPFVANNLELDAHHCLLLTGPNMAGKSTLMRQIAVTAIMAQTGSFVPAKSAILPLFDRIFTRIGASDYLAEGLSTFMVEMKETAEMLYESGAQSLVILDEVGRGTSTYDGMSLAQSILEYLVGQSKAMVLFATHYHELTQLAVLYPQIINAHMSISEKKGDIDFLYSLRRGPVNKSYGIQVAQLAGLPAEVTKRARHILQQLEAADYKKSGQLSLADISFSSLAESPTPYQDLIEDIRSISIPQITPLEALNRIASWQEKL